MTMVIGKNSKTSNLKKSGEKKVMFYFILKFINYFQINSCAPKEKRTNMQYFETYKCHK